MVHSSSFLRFLLILFLLSGYFAFAEDNATTTMETNGTISNEEKGMQLIQQMAEPIITETFTEPTAPAKKGFLPNKDIDISEFKGVTLLDVVLETVSNSYAIKAAREKVRRAQLDLDDAYAGYKPIVDLEYSNARTKKNPSDDGIDTGKHAFSDKTVTLTLKQNLYAGGATESKIRGLKKSLEVAKNRFELAISEKIQEAIKAYFGVVFSYQALAVSNQSMEMLQKILEIVSTKYDLGAASIGDISSIKASVANAESKLSKTNSKFVEALKYYEYIAGEDFKYTIPYEYDFEIKIDSLESLLKKGEQQNLNIVSYLLTIESEKYKLKSAKSEFLPKVDLEVSHTKIYNKDVPAEEFYGQDSNKVTLTAKYNLYNGGKDSNKILNSYSSIRETQFKIEEEKRKLKWIISNLHQSLNALESSIDSTIQEVESSKVTVESYWEAFRSGEQDLQTLLTAQRQLNTAQVSLVEYYENRFNDYFKLLFETGGLAKYFELDPTREDFIDFSRSKYNAKDNTLKQKGIDIGVFGQKKFNKEGVKPDTLEDILAFKDKFLDGLDSHYTLYISDFDSMYDAFGFAREHNLTKQTFVVDIFKDFKIKNAIGYGIFKEEDIANVNLERMQKVEGKEYKVVQLKTLKELYKKSLEGFDELRPKEIIETKTIKMAPKPPKPYFTDEDFKVRFLNSDNNAFTINLVTLSSLDDAIRLQIDENITKESLIFRYGENREWIKILYGVFDTYQEASAAMTKISKQTKEKYYPIIERIEEKRSLYLKYDDVALGTPSFYLEAPEFEQVSESSSTEVKSIDTSDIEDTNINPSSKCYTVTVDRLNVRSIPSLKARVLFQLAKGTALCAVSENSSWVEMGKGWVHKRYLEEVVEGDTTDGQSSEVLD